MTDSDLKKLTSYIGFAVKGGFALFGEDIICERLRLAKVVLIDGEAGEKYIERVKKRAGSVPTYVVGGLKDMLKRQNVKALAVTNESLAKAILDILR